MREDDENTDNTKTQTGYIQKNYENVDGRYAYN